MNSAKGLRVFVIGLALLGGALQAGKSIMNYSNEEADFTAYFTSKLREEVFYAKNFTLLNDCNDLDQVLYGRSTLDGEVGSAYGANKYGYEVAEMRFSLRNKVFWGSPNSIGRTTDSSIRGANSVFGSHKHDIPRLFLWIREVWLRFTLAEALNLSFKNNHDLTVGSFPFELGRGIALGAAYAVGPEFLGFYSDYNIDQFAFGAKLSGDLIQKSLAYDAYAAVLQNKSTSLSETGAEIYGQEYGRLLNPARGFGKIHYILAGRLLWKIFDTANFGKLKVEPYFLFNQDPEQKVEYLGDASSRFGTVGFAGEFAADRFEFGFDYAINMGKQHVKGWDRNDVIGPKSRNSYWREFNSHVVDQTGKQIPFIPGSPAEIIIDTTYQNESQNGKLIGVVNTSFGDLTPPIDLINSENRFRNPYVNLFRGWMFVADAGHWIYKKDLLISVTAGVASGDDNPNYVSKDGTYDGFIGLQEIYSGKRVRSAFVLGGAGKLKRPMSAPSTNQSPNQFASVVNGFTNLVFTGAAALWKPKCSEKEFSVHPNILFYWQEKATKKFDLKTKMDSLLDARPFLGVELNTFTYCYLVKSLKGFFVGSIFIPGSHYRDIRGKPLDRDQQAELEKYDVTGVAGPVPGLGTDTAFTFNLGVEYNF